MLIFFFLKKNIFAIGAIGKIQILPGNSNIKLRLLASLMVLFRKMLSVNNLNQVKTISLSHKIFLNFYVIIFDNDCTQ